MTLKKEHGWLNLSLEYFKRSLKTIFRMAAKVAAARLLLQTGKIRKEPMPLNLGEMTIEEKLKAMEILWDDICRSAPDFSSPAWHEDVLKEREQRIRNGKDNFVDWDDAKKDIRDSIT